MSKTTEPFPPLQFIHLLRQVNPQFAEMSRSGAGYAQQDADECWSQILTSLASGGLGKDIGGWTNKFMAAEMTTTLTCDEAPEEPSSMAKEKIMKLQCNISGTTNYVHTGIKDVRVVPPLDIPPKLELTSVSLMLVESRPEDSEELAIAGARSNVLPAFEGFSIAIIPDSSNGTVLLAARHQQGV